MNRIKLVSGDTRPQIYVSLYDLRTLTPINLTQIDVSMIFRAEGTTDVLATLAGLKLPGTVDPVTGAIDDNAAPSGVGGRVVFSWTSHALEVPPGYYDGEIILNFADGTKQTVYDRVMFKVRAPGG